MSTDREKELERELTELRDAVLSDWVKVASHATDALWAMEQTVSWRITKPLRAAKLLRNKVRQVGPSRAIRIAGNQLAAKLRPGR